MLDPDCSFGCGGREYADFWVSAALGDTEKTVKICGQWGIVDQARASVCKKQFFLAFLFFAERVSTTFLFCTVLCSNMFKILPKPISRELVGAFDSFDAFSSLIAFSRMPLNCSLL